MNQKRLKALLAKSQKKSEQRVKKRFARRGRHTGSKPTKQEVRQEELNGEPTTAALDIWSPRDYRAAFDEAARKHSRFKQGPVARDIAIVSRFLILAKDFALDEL